MELYVVNFTCFLFLFFITVVYFSAKRTKTYQHSVFKMMLIGAYVNIFAETIGTFCRATMNEEDMRYMGFDGIADMGTQSIENTRNVIAEIANYAYIVSLFFFFYTIFLYVRFLVTGETHKVISKCELGMLAPFVCSFIAAAIVTNVKNNPKNDFDEWSMGSPLTPVCAAFYIVVSIGYVIRYWKNVGKTQRMAVVMAMVAEISVTLIQASISRSNNYRIAGIGVVLMVFAFYMTVESPDALLIEHLKYEKERADSANNAKSAFLANMSHEIRTPMNAIVGMTEILLRTELTDQQKSYMHNIRHSGNSLLLIINDLLDFSKIEAGKMELVNENYDPMSLINDVSMIVLNRLGDKPVELLYDIDNKLPSKLYGDSGRVKQIIINLMNNAVKFTDEGFVKLTVKVVEKVGRNVTIRFDIEDSGQGISEEDLGKLFDAFKQVDMARNRKKEGTGLGLSISKQLAKMMGGDVSVTSTYGEGSDFFFTIKQKIIDDEPSAVIKEEILSEEKPVIGGCLCCHEALNIMNLVNAYGIEYKQVALETALTEGITHLFVDEETYESSEAMLVSLSEAGINVGVLYNPMKNAYSDSRFTFLSRPIYSLRFTRFMNHEREEVEAGDSDNIIRFSAPDAEIMIVDDTDMNLKVAVGLLTPLNMKIDVARSGKEAISKAKKKKYHIIFMDHMMPGMDGIETIKNLRALEEQEGYYKTAKIVALTANAAGDAKEAFANVGVEEFVTKPIEIKQLAAVIKRNLPQELIKKPITLEELNPMKAAKILPAIAGLNVAEGIKNSGTEELFENLLGDFYKLIDMKSSKIEKCMEDGLTRDFTIEVHALKNTARMIGATDLSEMFKEMEDLGHEEKVEEIKKRLPEVMEKYRSLKPSLLPYAVKNDTEKEEVPRETILETLADIKEAMENFDVDRADASMEKLESYKLDEATVPLMDNLRAYIADVAMEEVIKTCDDLTQLITLS